MAQSDVQWQMIGAKVPAKKSVGFESGLVGSDLHTAHITQVALGPDPKPGRHTVFIETSNGKIAVGTLEQDRCEQFQVDLVGDMLFSHTGKSDVYLSGYNSISPFNLGDDSSDEYLEDDDDNEAPAAVPLKQPKLMGSKAALARQQALLAADEAEDESELEADEDDDDDDDDESEDEAALQKGIASLKKTLAGAPLNGKIFDMRDDDEESEDDSEDEDEEDDSEDDSEDDDPDVDVVGDVVEQVPASKGKGKRAGPAAAATPQPQKKAKVALSKAPASAPPASARSQAATQAGTEQSQYEQDLKAYLKQSGGEAQLSLLGSVKKPESLPKSTRLKAFLQAHPGSFTVQGDRVVLK